MTGTRNTMETQNLIKDSINELFTSKEFISQVTKTITDKIEQKLKMLEDNVKSMNDKITSLEQKIDNFEQLEKINNLCLYGVSEQTNELLTTRLLQLFNEKGQMDIKKEDIRTAFRIGKQKPQDKPRPVILKYQHYEHKLLVMKNVEKLKGCKIFIAEDLTKKRKTLLLEDKAAFGERANICKKLTGIRFYCDPKKTYIIIGGLGGFGLELADWLILRGAKKLILSSTRGFSNGYQRMRVNVWESYGAIIQITTLDLSTKSGCAQLIREAHKLGPVDAIFNLAVCLKDALFENQTKDMFKESLTPKAYITKHLDQLTREMCPDLRGFVVFSSVSCGKGNAGQTNYGMANSIMERICEARQRDGYAGKAIQWGAVGEVGILGEMMENNATEINICGTLLQKISSCLQVLDTLLSHPSPIVSSIVVAEKTRDSYSKENVVEAVASIIGITDLKSVSLHSTLSEIGMDSMTAVEIKQVLELEFDIFLSPKELKTLTLSKLQEIQDSMSSKQTSVDNGSLEETEVNLNLYHVEESESRILDIRVKSKVAENQNAPTILVIPGIEGFMKTLEPLCEKLEAHVHGLQFNYDEAPDTILDMAQMKLPFAEQHFSKNKPFQMIAYSYGVAEALELVGLLEARGYKGTIYCIDGAPAVMHYFSKIVFGKTTDEIETNSLLGVMKAHNVPSSGMQKMALDYRKCKTLEEKVGKTIEEYGHQIGISNEYMERLMKGTVKRVLALSAYKPSYTTLKSRLVLFKPRQPTYTHRFDDFGLGEISEKPVLWHIIEGNHTTLLSNDELSKYINSYLLN